LEILAQQNPDNTMRWMLQDGLHSIRGMSDGNDMLSAQAYSPYGEPMFTDMPTEFGFIGEQTDPTNDLVYLRARVMNPKLGIFGSLDPFEGELSAPLTMNGYGWVEGNTPNLTDATGWSTGTCQAPSKGLSPLTASGSLGLVSLPKKAPSSSYDFWTFMGSILGSQQANDAKYQFVSNRIDIPNSYCLENSLGWFSVGCGTGGGELGVIMLTIAAGVATISSIKQLTLDTPSHGLLQTSTTATMELSDFTNDFALLGFASKVGTIAEHLAKSWHVMLVIIVHRVLTLMVVLIKVGVIQ